MSEEENKMQVIKPEFSGEILAKTEEFEIVLVRNKTSITLNINDEEKIKVKQFLELSNIEYESEDL